MALRSSGTDAQFLRNMHLSGIAVLGDVIREYLPVNLILTFGFINVGIMLLKMYFQKKFEEKSLYADNHYD